MNADQFDQLMRPFTNMIESHAGNSIAVACSGGSDSMALTVLLHRWCDTNDTSLHALIVDHKLRSESAEEALVVSERLRSLGVENYILSEEPQTIESNIQSQARDLRYRLLTQWCDDNDVRHLALAHHKQDQAETFLMRLGRGSGVLGLGAMKNIEVRGNVTLLRPLLHIDKSVLSDYLIQHGTQWVEDPSNQLTKFGRVRMRALSDTLDKEGISADRLLKTSTLMQKSQDALDWSMCQALQSDLKVYDVGAFSVSLESLLAMPEMLSLRALSLLLKSAAGQEYPPRLTKLENLYQALKDSEGTNFSTNSFGAQLRIRKNRLWVGREVAKVSPAKNLNVKSFDWDGRFVVPKKVGPDEVRIAALGISGWQKWAGKFNKDKDDCLYPSFVRQAVPALFTGPTLIAPVASLFGEDSALISEKVGRFGIKFKIPVEFRDFTFSSAYSDTM